MKVHVGEIIDDVTIRNFDCDLCNHKAIFKNDLRLHIT